MNGNPRSAPSSFEHGRHERNGNASLRPFYAEQELATMPRKIIFYDYPHIPNNAPKGQ
jgi:hypothetical protein